MKRFRKLAARLVFLLLVIVLVTFLLPAPINPWVGLLFKPLSYETAGVHELSIEEAVKFEASRQTDAKARLEASFKVTGSIEGIFENSVSRIRVLGDRSELKSGQYEGRLADIAIEVGQVGATIGGGFTLVRGIARRNIAHLKQDGEL